MALGWLQYSISLRGTRLSYRFRSRCQPTTQITAVQIEPVKGAGTNLENILFLFGEEGDDDFEEDWGVVVSPSSESSSCNNRNISFNLEGLSS